MVTTAKLSQLGIHSAVAKHKGVLCSAHQKMSGPHSLLSDLVWCLPSGNQSLQGTYHVNMLLWWKMKVIHLIGLNWTPCFGRLCTTTSLPRSWCPSKELTMLKHSEWSAAVVQLSRPPQCPNELKPTSKTVCWQNLLPGALCMGLIRAQTNGLIYSYCRQTRCHKTLLMLVVSRYRQCWSRAIVTVAMGTQEGAMLPSEPATCQ